MLVMPGMLAALRKTGPSKEPDLEKQKTPLPTAVQEGGFSFTGTSPIAPPLRSRRCSSLSCTSCLLFCLCIPKEVPFRQNHPGDGPLSRVKHFCAESVDTGRPYRAFEVLWPSCLLVRNRLVPPLSTPKKSVQPRFVDVRTLAFAFLPWPQGILLTTLDRLITPDHPSYEWGVPFL